MIIKGRTFLCKYILGCRDMAEYFFSNVFLQDKIYKMLSRIFMVCLFGVSLLFSSCIPESDLQIIRKVILRPCGLLWTKDIVFSIIKI